MTEEKKKHHLVEAGKNTRWSSTHQPTKEQRHDGQVRYNARKKLFEDLANILFHDDAPSKAYDGAKKSLELGDVKPLIELLKMVKLPDKLEIDNNIKIKQALVEFVDVEDGRNGKSESSDTEDIPESFN